MADEPSQIQERLRPYQTLVLAVDKNERFGYGRRMEDLFGVEVFSVAAGIVIVTVLLTPLLLRRTLARAAAPNLPMKESS